MDLERISRPVRGALQRLGFNLIRFRSVNTVLARHGVNVVFDVGANVGQYGSKLRSLGYKGKIVSFEPQMAPFAALSAVARRDGNWVTANVGLGSEESRKTINVYTDSCLSSMLALDRQTYIHESELAGTEIIEILPLDTIIDQYVQPDDKMFLKIDTQGFEKQVLGGAEQCLSRMVGVQIEMSLTPLYADQPRLDEMIALLHAKGFMLWQIHRGFYNAATGQELEADGIFIQEKYAK